MELSADTDKDVKVSGDKDKLRQVINILLDNALKYSDPADKVTVKLKRHSSECILSVSGLGTPLTKEECENIFKRFYRMDQARNDGQSYGLGLSIADSIIKEHNGKIWAESENGYNTFYVSLPF
jgi:signal transduction histidine kinase